MAETTPYDFPLPFLTTEPCGCRFSRRTAVYYHYCDRHRKSWLHSIDLANRYLEAAALRCYFRINGACELACPARPYCDPALQALTDVADVKDLETGEDHG